MGNDSRARLAPILAMVMSRGKKQTNCTERCRSINENSATQLIISAAAVSKGIAHRNRATTRSTDKIAVVSSAVSVNSAVNLGRHDIIVIRHNSKTGTLEIQAASDIERSVQNRELKNTFSKLI